MKPPFLQIAALLLPTIACGQNNTTEEWIQLFNGENLDNWQVKFTGQELGANYRETFRVENSLLTVSYEN